MPLPSSTDEVDGDAAVGAAQRADACVRPGLEVARVEEVFQRQCERVL